ncbi:MAG: DNA-protecting protein DprA [Oscillospiraceae bacterium]|nr:DNA-protecting protein DprA [Oscillospiraceae bacterium]
MAELKYWIWMNELGINPLLARRVLEHLGGPKEAFFAERDSFLRIPGITERELPALLTKDLDKTVRILGDMQALGGRVLTQQDAEYPERLRNIDDAPIVLYVRGRLPLVDNEAVITVAGTRKCSTYGLRAAARIAGEVTRHGGIVVSGLASGVDTAAAQGALSEGGPVIGVLGCGLERVYPPENLKIFEAVLENGCLVSEYPPGAPPSRHHFPRRNRIMTGLALALVAVEIPTEKSGVMHSVNHAIDQGRDVFIVPANIDARTSMASNKLIAEGFQAASTGWQVLEGYTGQFPQIKDEEEVRAARLPVKRQRDLPVPAVKRRQASTKKEIDKPAKEVYIDLEAARKRIMEGRSEAEQAVLACLNAEPIHVDEIIAKSGLPVAKVSVCLTTLGIGGYIREHPGKRYSIQFD